VSAGIGSRPYSSRGDIHFVPRIIAFRFIPNSIVTKPVGAIWYPLISRPFFSLPYHTRLAMGWLALIGIVFGSAFGFSLPAASDLHLLQHRVLSLSSVLRVPAMETVRYPCSVSLYSSSVSTWLQKHATILLGILSLSDSSSSRPSRSSS
jgi:hypothetical protein